MTIQSLDANPTIRAILSGRMVLVPEVAEVTASVWD